VTTLNPRESQLQVPSSEAAAAVPVKRPQPCAAEDREGSVRRGSRADAETDGGIASAFCNRQRVRLESTKLDRKQRERRSFEESDGQCPGAVVRGG
jgi:hypothetical protein